MRLFPWPAILPTGDAANLERIDAQPVERGGTRASVEEQGAANKETTRNTRRSGAQHAGVSRGAGMTESAADHVLASADQLGSTSLHLKQEVDAFLAAIPAA